MGDYEIGVKRQSAAEKGDAFLLGGSVRSDGAEGGEDGPGTFGVLVDSGTAVGFGEFGGTDLNHLGAFGEECEGPVGARGVQSRGRSSGREAFDENAIAPGELDAIEKVDGGREIDTARLDKLSKVTWGISLGKTAEYLGTVEGRRLGVGERRGEIEKEEKQKDDDEDARRPRGGR